MSWLWVHLFCLFVILLPAISQGGLLMDLVKKKKPVCQPRGEKCSIYRACCGDLRCIVDNTTAPYCASLNTGRAMLPSPTLALGCVLSSLTFIYGTRLIVSPVHTAR